MYYTEEISMKKAEGLLIKCGLSVPEGVEYTAGVFDDVYGLAATGSLKGDMIQGIAVDPAKQGEDLMGKLMTHLIGEAGRRGRSSLHLFTKPEKAVQFMGLGFRTVATARPYAAVLEWGSGGIREYQKYLEKVRTEAEEKLKAAGKKAETAAAIVMNCNPFTKGHRYLVETAATAADILYVIVVEEDKSVFPFKDRFEMVKRGTADIENVTVLTGGRYAVSSLTFPSYFTKEEKLAEAHTAMDAELFARCIAPKLNVNMRFVGTEPHSPVTAIYNKALMSRLPQSGIGVYEIRRCEIGGKPVSASRARALMKEMANGNCSWISAFENTDMGKELAEILPETTISYIKTSDLEKHLYKEFSDGK